MIRVYDHSQDGTSMRVRENSDGTFYMENGKFDSEAKDEKELIEKLERWGYYTEIIGYEC